LMVDRPKIPWLCVPTSRWVCPGRPMSGGRVRPHCQRTTT
jgi:hypothetical protein